jgi:GNAT superfamily N-acetyltransferase
MKDVKIDVQVNPPKPQRDFVVANLIEYNRSKAGDSKTKDVAIFAKQGLSGIVGGLLGFTLWNGFFVSALWVDEPLRGTGIGSRLLKEAESFALEHGCDLIHLDTFEFQARGFYEKNGFEVFGILENYSPGGRRYYLQKRLLP